MRNFRSIMSISAAVLSLMAPRVVLAQAATPPAPSATAIPPVVILHSSASGSASAADLKGIPPDVAKLILNFDALRDKYLLKQHLLLEKLQNATTQAQRDAIREELQDNRQAFLDELSDFRIQLKDELKSVQGRISNAEFLRIIDAAQGAPGNLHHRGH
jgi:hypothetical protein